MSKKLKTEDQVLFWDGYFQLELCSVTSIDKKTSRAKLSNRVYVNREPDEEDSYRRVDYKAAQEDKERNRKRKKNPKIHQGISKTWKYEGSKISLYEAYLAKKRLVLQLESIISKLPVITIEELLESENKVDKLLKLQKSITKFNG